MILAGRCAGNPETNGGGFLGMKRVLRQPCDSAPHTRARRFGIQPNVASQNK